MNLTISMSWPFIAAIVGTGSVFVWLAWMHSEPSHGPYDFTGIFTIPTAAFFIAVVWLAYFAARVWLGF